MTAHSQWVVRQWHWLRMDMFMYWKWEIRMKRTTSYANGCGWCEQEEVPDGRCHMLLDCRAWNRARMVSGISDWIESLRTRGMSDESIARAK